MKDKNDWCEVTGNVRGCLGCLTTLLVGLAIDAALILAIVWLVRAILGW